MAEARLRQVQVFAGVDEARLLALEPHLAERICRPNEAVYRVGDPWDGLYAVVHGAVVLRTERPGRPIESGLKLGSGDVFGEAELSRRSARELTVRAVGATTVLRIPPGPLDELLAESSSADTLLRGLAVRRRMVHVRSILTPTSTRKEPRIWVDQEVLLTLEDGTRIAARLEDLSRSGACLSAVPEAWRAGSQVAFALGIADRPCLLQARGFVRWRDGNLAGISFEEDGSIQRRQMDLALRTLVPSALRKPEPAV